MRKIRTIILNLKSLILILTVGMLTACDVHEWPETPEYVKLHLRLNYETDMTEWEHLYDRDSFIEQGLGETYDNHLDYGMIRYIVRTYPISESMRSISNYTQEYVFTKEISEGYDHEVILDVLPGNYNVMVWSDLVQTTNNSHSYNAANFAEIRLQGDHMGNNDYRDAFRGTNTVSLVADIVEQLPDTLDITMQRPLAKFEFVTNDLVDFIYKESVRIASKGNGDKGSSNIETPTRTVDIEDYKVVFYYVGFMPDTYSMNTDKPVDSSTGVMFESTLTQLSDSEATMGFDYVFVNGKKSAVTMKIGICDNEGTQISLTKPIEVPLKRSHHTIMTGRFLMSESSEGVTINPDFDGEHNLFFP